MPNNDGKVLKAIALNCPNLENLIISCSGIINEDMIFPLEKLVKIKVLHLRQVTSLTDQFVEKIINENHIPQIRHLWFGDHGLKSCNRPNISNSCLDRLSKKYGLPRITISSSSIFVPKIFTRGIFISESEVLCPKTHRGYY